jgi:hypothetical protein
MKQIKVTSKEANKIQPDYNANKIKIIKVKNTTVIVK